MHKKFTAGKIIASIIAIAIAGYFWNRFFPPGGAGANILLGIAVAIFFVYYFARYFGGIIDQEVFPGGTRKRARLFRSLKCLVEESQEHISLIKKSKRQRKKYGQKALDHFDQSMIQAVLVLNQVRDNWDTKSDMNSHEAMLKEAYDKLDGASHSIFGLGRNYRFLYGMPSLIGALILALMVREFIIEPYQIPSGSMIPSLLVGDHLFVNKGAYGISKPFTSEPDFIVKWKEPKVGDVIIFKAPEYVGRHAGQAWVKRVVAKEGQKISIKNNVVYVDDMPYSHIKDDQLVSYMDFFGFGTADAGTWKEKQAYKNLEKIGDISHEIHTPAGHMDPRLGPNWPLEGLRLPGISCFDGACRVKPGHIFVMGDNRGNSADSRMWGGLPLSQVKGKASFIWISVDGSGQSIKLGPFTLPKFRWSRSFKGIS